TRIRRAFVASGCCRSDRMTPFSLSLRLQRTRQLWQRPRAAKFAADPNELSTDLRRFSQIRNRSSLVVICENLGNLRILLLSRRSSLHHLADCYLVLNFFLSFFCP